METFGSAVLQVATTAGGTLVLGRNDTSVASGSGIGNIYFNANDSTGNAWNEIARISVDADGDHANNDYPSRMEFYTTGDGEATPTERVRITSDGKVGIGDDNPDVPLNVKAGGASFAGQTTHVKIEDTTSLAANVGGLLAFEGVYNSNGDPAAYAMIHGGKENATTGNYAGYLRFLTRPSGALPQERLRISSSGVVGINTDVSGNGAGAKLVVGGRIQSNAGGYWFAGANGAEDGWHVQDSGGNLTVVESGVAERLRITSAGYVGINETSPDTYLHVKTSTDSALVKLEQTATNGRAQVQYLNPHGDWIQGIQGATNTGDFLIYTAQAKHLTFYTSGTLRQKIQSDGKVIIGGNANQTANRNLSVVAAPGNSNEAQIGLQPTNSSGGYNPEVFISAMADGTYGAHMFFKTRDTSGNRLERLRIQSDGIVRLSTPGNIQDGTFYASQTINNTGSNTYSRIRFDRSNVAKFGLTLRNDDKFCISNLFKDGSVSADDEAFVMTNSSNIGVGFASPQTALNVKGTISTGRNLAREVGTVISYSTQFNSSRSASNVINGKKNYENGNNDWLTAGNNRDNAWVVIDLGAQYTIDRIVIYNQNEYNGSRREVKRFNLEGSNDNSSWTLLIDDELGRSDAHEPNPGFSFRLPHVSSPGSFVDDDEGVSYRYWKFHMKDFHSTDPYGGIMEIELYEASNDVDSEVSTHSVVASDVYTQTLSAQRLAIGENGVLGDFRANTNENVYINAAARFGENTSDTDLNATRHTGWRMYGYNSAWG